MQLTAVDIKDIVESKMINHKQLRVVKIGKHLKLKKIKVKSKMKDGSI